jgi:type I restriction enzyme S subunit
MINNLRPYANYVESSASWGGKTPASWSTLRAKRVFSTIDIRSETGAEELLTVSARDGVLPRSQKTVTMFKAESYVGHKLCWPGDLVINSLWAWMQGLGFSRQHGLVSSAYSVYRLQPAFQDYANYFNYALRSPAYKWDLMTRSKGVWISRLQLLDSAFLDMPLIVPPANDQSAIVRFIDHLERQVRRVVLTKRKLIGLINEQKQAIIKQMVTRGLDAAARLKSSGVEWLGDVPEHWEIVPLKFISCRVQNGSTPSTLVAAYYDGGHIPWYGPSSCGHKEEVGEPVRYLTDSAVIAGRARLIEGPALLIVVIGTVGKVALLTGNGATNQQITSYELRSEKVDPLFVLRQIRNATHFLRETADV